MSVGRNAPTGSGVYGLSDSVEWIYVGETANIQSELLRHLKTPHEFLMQHPPSGFTFELTTAGQRIERQSQLVSELQPIGNRKVA